MTDLAGDDYVPVPVTFGVVESASVSRGSRQTFLAILLLAVVLLGANYKLTLGIAVPRWDADQMFAPFQMLVADHARAGTFLLWDPWLNGGSPDYAEPQIPTFSPVAMAIGFITGGTEAAFQVYWLVIWFLAGLGVFLLGRHFGAPRWGCIVSALAFMFSGFYTGHAEHTSTLWTISSLPFVIWRLDVALARGARRAAVEAGVIWGVSGLGGYPGWLWLNACFAMLWTIGRVWIGSVAESDPHRPTWRSAAVTFATLSFVGILVLLPTYVAFFMEAPGYTDRAGPLTRDLAANFNALHPGALATFASPYLTILKLENPDLWAYTDPSTVSIYLGPIVPVLALIALANKPRDRRRWWIAALGIVFLLTALGQALPLRGWLYDVLSPMRYFRHAGIARIYLMFAMVILALIGTRDLALAGHTSPQLYKRFAVIAALLSLVAISAFYVVMRIVQDPGQDALAAQLHLWIAWAAVSAIGVFLLRTHRTRLLPILLIAVAVADGFFTAHLSQPTLWYEGARFTEVWRRLANEHNPSFDLSSRGLERAQRPPAWTIAEGVPHDKNLPLKIPTLDNYLAIHNRFHVDLVKRPVLSAMATGKDRIWCAAAVAAVPPSDVAYAAFVERSESLAKGVVVVHPRYQMTSREPPTPGEGVGKIHELPPATHAVVRLISYDPDELSFEATCPEKGWLLVTDRWARGWHAAVNGTPTEVWGGNFIFRAVPIDAGQSLVQFTYRPAGFPFLVILSWSVMFATLAWTLTGSAANHIERDGQGENLRD